MSPTEVPKEPHAHDVGAGRAMRTNCPLPGRGDARAGGGGGAPGPAWFSAVEFPEGVLGGPDVLAPDAGLPPFAQFVEGSPGLAESMLAFLGHLDAPVEATPA
jgi:hypothetical protein